MQFKETVLNNNPCPFPDTKKTLLKKLPRCQGKAGALIFQAWESPIMELLACDGNQFTNISSREAWTHAIKTELLGAEYTENTQLKIWVTDSLQTRGILWGGIAYDLTPLPLCCWLCQRLCTVLDSH